MDVSMEVYVTGNFLIIGGFLEKVHKSLFLRHVVRMIGLIASLIFVPENTGGYHVETIAEQVEEWWCASRFLHHLWPNSLVVMDSTTYRTHSCCSEPFPVKVLDQVEDDEVASSSL